MGANGAMGPKEPMGLKRTDGGWAAAGGGLAATGRQRPEHRTYIGTTVWVKTIKTMSAKFHAATKFTEIRYNLPNYLDWCLLVW